MAEEAKAANRPHTGRRRNEAAREAILAATVQLLRDGGLDGLTVDAIAQTAGVGRQTIYRWWPSKGAMLAEAMGLQAAAVVPPRDSGSFEADLTAFWTDSFRALADPAQARGVRDVAAEAQHDEHVAEALAGFTAQRRSTLRAVLQRGVDQGRISPGTDLDLLTDLGYGFLWYRLLVRHRPLDDQAAQDLSAYLIAAGRGVKLTNRPSVNRPAVTASRRAAEASVRTGSPWPKQAVSTSSWASSRKVSMARARSTLNGPSITWPAPFAATLSPVNSSRWDGMWTAMLPSVCPGAPITAAPPPRSMRSPLASSWSTGQGGAAGSPAAPATSCSRNIFSSSVKSGAGAGMSPRMTGASTRWASTRAPLRRASSAAEPTWSP
jgi:AcrR family transcriptional regulator